MAKNEKSEARVSHTQQAQLRGGGGAPTPEIEKKKKVQNWEAQLKIKN